jgi:F-type H+-transporting ATPase subunit b
MLLSLLFLSTPAYAAGDMSLFPDPALVVLQTFPFLAAMGVLHFFIFKPMIGYLQDRDAATVGARADAARLQQEADQKQSQYEARQADARKQVVELRAQARAEAKVVREARLAEVRLECDGVLNEARGRIDSERELAAKELDKVAAGLAGEISAKVLGREFGGVA